MPIGRHNPTPQQQVKPTTAESFSDVDGVTLNGGVHSAVGRNKMIFSGDAAMTTSNVRKAKKAASQDDSTTSKASMFPGAKNAVLNGVNTESIGGASIIVNDNRRKAASSPTRGVQNEWQPARTHHSNNTQMPTTGPRPDSQADSCPSTRRIIEAKVGSKAQNLEVGQGAILSATAGSRVIGNNLDEVLALMSKAKEFEELDRDRRAEVLTDSVGAKIRGEVVATGGVDVAVRAPSREKEGGGSPKSRKSRNRASDASSRR